MNVLGPTREQDVVDAVCGNARVVPHGRMTKAPLVPHAADAVRLDMTAFTGVIEYDPGEFTFTARAGTPLREIEALLAHNGQYMPFDPPLAEDGATLGGTLAAGLSGPCRLRYGGLRDFVIGVRFVDGTGSIVRGGGKVVKNAAGFDLPKLMVGSAGRLGVLLDLTFKVFPAPQAARTLRIRCHDLDDALARTAALVRQPLDIEALEHEPPATLVVQIAGAHESLDAHAARVGRAADRPFEVLNADEDVAYWRALRAFAWVPAAHWLIKVPLTARRVAALDRALDAAAVLRRYSVAANVAWLAWPAERPLAQLDLTGLNGLIVRGAPTGDRPVAPDGHIVRGPRTGDRPVAPADASPWIGGVARTDAAFAAGVKDALDPQRRMPQLL